MKKNIILLILINLFIFPLVVNAANANSEVYVGNNKNLCTNSKYQDSNIFTSKSAYFGKCMEAVCKSNHYIVTELKKDTVQCTNGNKQPYREVKKNGCYDLQRSPCNENEIKYCSMLFYYDCSKNNDGSDFTTTTTTTTTKPKTETPHTETTTSHQPVTIINTKLKSLTLSSGSISFNSDVYEYNLNLESSVNNITVNAIPIDSNNSVNVTGNQNIKNNSVISITVTASTGDKSVYKINIKKQEEKLSSNKRLKSLTIKDYNINFSPNINEYNLKIKEGIDKLDIEYTAEDDLASVSISGNKELKHGSKIVLSVTAQDGSVGYYNINILVKKSSNIIKILFIIILILAIGAGGYYVYIKFIKNRGGEKYEYE